jgi:hypothetical protein
MDKPKFNPVPPELIEQVFPWPEDVPLPRPRFGSVTRQQSGRLPDLVARNDDRGPRPPFRLVWESDTLGLKVRVEEEVGEQAGQLSVTVLSNRPEHLGKEAKVVLIGKAGTKDERYLLTAVPLNAARLDPMSPDAQKPIGCSGRVLLGSPADLRARLGDGEIALDAFLLV